MQAQLLLAAGINSQLRISVSASNMQRAVSHIVLQEKHAECEEDLTDSGETALDIVSRCVPPSGHLSKFWCFSRLKQMSLVEAENAKKVTDLLWSTGHLALSPANHLWVPVSSQLLQVQRILQEEQKRAKEEDRERKAGDKGKPDQRRSSIKKDSMAKAP